MKHQNYNTNMKISAIDCYYGLPNELKIKGLHIDRSKPSESFETLLKHLGIVRKVEDESKDESKDEFEKKLPDYKNQLFSLQESETRNSIYRLTGKKVSENNINEFCDTLIVSAKKHDSFTDWVKHYTNWLRLQDEKPEQSESNSEREKRLQDRAEIEHAAYIESLRQKGLLA